MLKAKTAFRQLKHRRLKALRQSKTYLALGEADRERKESECLSALEEEHNARIFDLEVEWNRKLEESDIDQDESKAEEVQVVDEHDEEWAGSNDEELTGIHDEEWTGIHDDEEVPLDEVVRRTMSTTFEERMRSWDALLARIEKDGNELLGM